MSTGKIELSVGAIKIGDKHDIFTEEEIDNINKIPVIEDELEESVKFEIVGEGTTVPPISGGGSNYDDTEIREMINEVNASLDNNMRKINNSKFYFTDYKQTTDTDKFNAIINDIKLNDGGILILPEGEFIINNGKLTSNLTIIGKGIGKTILRQEENSYVINGGDVSYNNITIKDLSIIGTAESHKTQIPEAGRPIVIKRSKNVTIENIQVKWFAGLGISLLDCYNVKIINNIVEHTGRDSINCAGCKGVVISNNNINHGGDDAIAVHDASNQTLYVPEHIQGVTIIGNVIYNSNGISCVGGQQCNITGNTLKFIRGTGINITYASDVNNKTQIKGNIISNNIITDIFDKADSVGIKISGGNVEQVTFESTKPELLKGTSNFIANNFVIANNVIGQTMESLSYQANWNLQDNWTLPDRAIYGIRLFGMMKDINVTSNNITRCNRAIEFYPNEIGGIQPGLVDNLFINSNIFTRCDYGYYHNNKVGSYPKLNIVINSNLFDLDPYNESGLRNDLGEWTSKVDKYCGIFSVNISYFPITNNVFRNVCNITNYAIVCCDNNIIDRATCYDYSSVDFNGGVYGAEKSWLNVKKTAYTRANNVPTTGKWFKSDIVYNTDTRGGRYIGWVCVKTGEFGTESEPQFKGFGLIEN